jgi:hypothetical protein
MEALFMNTSTVVESHKGSRFNRYRPEVFASVERWRMSYVPPTSDIPEKAAEGFSIMSLRRPFITPADVRLPPVDSEGFPHGENYAALLKARTPSMSTRTTLPGLKFKRRFEVLSLGELRILLALWFNPYIVDLREQYGRFDTADFYRALDQGMTLARSQLMTIDIIATYVSPKDGRLRNHAISVKSRNYEPTDEDSAREARERSSAALAGWTWELLLGNAVTDVEYGNYGFLWSVVRNQNLPSLYAPARRFAQLLVRVSDRGSLEEMLGRAAIRAGIGHFRAARLFAVAVAYGFLTPDHRCPIRTHQPLYLIR